MHYHVNNNIPGYLPESDGVTTESHSDALTAFREEIGCYQETWSEYCGKQHNTEAQLANCLSGGDERCGWQELFVEAEADRLKLEEMTIPEGEGLTYVYITPEGADVAIFLQACSEADCVMTWEED